MYGQIDGWANEETNTSRRKSGLTDRRSDGRGHRQANRQGVGRLASRWVDGWVVGGRQAEADGRWKEG